MQAAFALYRGLHNINHGIPRSTGSGLVLALCAAGDKENALKVTYTLLKLRKICALSPVTTPIWHHVSSGDVQGTFHAAPLQLISYPSLHLYATLVRRCFLQVFDGMMAAGGRTAPSDEATSGDKKTASSKTGTVRPPSLPLLESPYPPVCWSVESLAWAELLRALRRWARPHLPLSYNLEVASQAFAILKRNCPAAPAAAFGFDRQVAWPRRGDASSTTTCPIPWPGAGWPTCWPRRGSSRRPWLSSRT